MPQTNSKWVVDGNTKHRSAQLPEYNDPGLDSESFKKLVYFNLSI